MHKISLVGGGTAGHVEPALAVGRWLESNSPDIQCEFIGTKKGLEVELLKATNWKFTPILKAPLPRKINQESIFWPIKFAIAVSQSIFAIRNSSLIIGFGGYASAPVYVAAKLLRKPILIHEANAMPGFANRLGAKWAVRVTVAFEIAKRQSSKWSEATLVGMPIRSEIRELAGLKAAKIQKIRNKIYEEFDFDKGKPLMFAFGGSLGATSINSAISKGLNSILNLTNVIHSVGSQNPVPNPRAGYKALAYVKNMSELYAACDLVISRSGAVSCAEIAEVGRYGVLVPLPIGNGEQEANAEQLVESGAAILCQNKDFNEGWLLSNLPLILDRAVKFKAREQKHDGPGGDEALGRIALDIVNS